MKKCLIIISVMLAVISCDPERVFVDAGAKEVPARTMHDVDTTYSETILKKEFRQVTKAVSYKGHEFIVFYYEGPYTVDVEVVEIKD